MNEEIVPSFFYLQKSWNNNKKWRMFFKIDMKRRKIENKLKT